MLTTAPMLTTLFLVEIRLISLSGVLSVADDLVKGDGQSFLELMEHLAERKLQGEDQLAHVSTATGTHSAEISRWSDDA